MELKERGVLERAEMTTIIRNPFNGIERMNIT